MLGWGALVPILIVKTSGMNWSPQASPWTLRNEPGGPGESEQGGPSGKVGPTPGDEEDGHSHCPSTPEFSSCALWDCYSVFLTAFPWSQSLATSV